MYSQSEGTELLKYLHLQVFWTL
uniref:Uncharacterized protein n=1 Tax=Moniliophthora roreri TaxID=221103 RepID=A0A0W0FDM4_MONRR